MGYPRHPPRPAYGTPAERFGTVPVTLLKRGQDKDTDKDKDEDSLVL
jgi:hypothetical protein